MNRKTILVFILGAAASAVILGALQLVMRQGVSPAPDSASEPQPIRAAVPSEIFKTPALPGLPEAGTPSASETEAFRQIFSPNAGEHAVFYEVQAGDNLTRIARQNGTTVEIIQKINHLSGDRILPGMKLKIPTYRFSLVVDKSQNILILKGDEEVLKTYRVSTGKDNSTPVGVFKITDKLVNPTWYKAGAIVAFGSPENVLGTRWLGITQQGYGIHGTVEPEMIGQQVTEGCVRMINDEVEELYAIVPSGAEVTIVD